ncbi:PREDICTED: uncharacterized protein LOC104773016 [Camelina sativa]|uniref:Uncharacterized protein LOC104773016 n=1 Tax=Camelina sativa TaxID=90675 RepID=A0ABM0Y5I4_CAMSA|nr:PREDICTED: uncharacterized protein LOC104773016 [Camelina sativa]
MENAKPIVTSIVLKGTNYLLWTRTTRTALGGRGLWSHVETDYVPKKNLKGEDECASEVEVEEESERKAKWFQEDQVVLSVHQNSLDTPILEAYSYCETAKELWETLKNVYGNVSNLTRVFEVKKAINELNQDDLHILRAEKLPSFEDICSQIQKEQGSLDLFSGKGELVTANKGVYKQEYRKVWICDHCKKRGHMKDKCWILHPHLKPAKFKANLSKEATSDKGAGSSKQGDEAAMTTAYGEVVRKSDLEALIRSIASLKESGISFFTSKPSKSLVIDSGASHHMISNPSLINNITPALGNVIIANGEQIPDIETGKVLGEGQGSGDLYVLEKTSPILSTSNKSCFVVNSDSMWHARLGHPHSRALALMLPNVLRSDNGGEYTSHKFKEHLAKHGILQQTSCPYTLQQNGVAERKNRHLMEVARSMMFHSHVTRRYWGDAVMTACYLINRTPTKVLNDLSPFEGYKCYDPTTSRLYVSRDVRFMENVVYLDNKDWNTSTRPESRPAHTEGEPEPVDVPEDVLPPDHVLHEPNSMTTGAHGVPITPTEEHLEEASTASDAVDSHQGEPPTQPVLRISERVRSHPSTWKDKRVYYNSQAIAHPIQTVCSLELLPVEQQAFFGQVDAHWVPQTYDEAKEHKEWLDAVVEESGAMIRNHMWDEADLPNGQKGCEL